MRVAALIVAAAGAAVLLMFGSALQQELVFRATLLLVLTTSWNMMANAGLISLGHSAFWGMGAYAAVILVNRAGVPFAAALVGAQVAGAVLGAVMAGITGRLRGMFFGIATLALAEGLRVGALMLSDLTGGAGGMNFANGAAPGQGVLKALALLYAVLSVLIAWLLSRSRFHYAFRAMRSSQDAAQMIGIDPIRFRVGIVALSGLLAAGAGAIGASADGYLDPALAFTMQNTIMPQIAAILGGVYTVGGPILGAATIIVIVHATTLVSTTLAGVGLFCLGLVLILAVILLPSGIMGLFDAHPGQKSPSWLARLRRAAP